MTTNQVLIGVGIVLATYIILTSMKKSNKEDSSNRRAIKSSTNPYNPKEPKSNACGCGH